jgi:hypothetical protein
MGSDDGVENWDSVHNVSETTRFRPHVGGGRHLLRWVRQKEVTSRSNDWGCDEGTVSELGPIISYTLPVTKATFRH